MTTTHTHAPRRRAASNGQPSNAPNAGTLGGSSPRAAGRRPGRYSLQVGDEMYLWVLVVIEVIVMGLLRNKFRRYHGG